MLAFFLLAACTAAMGKGERGPVVRAPGAVEQLGIEVVALRWTAEGNMIDLRYRVTDPEKATYILDGKVIPYLLHEKTGAKFLVPSSPKVGPMRQKTRHPVAGNVYFIMFANPGRYVKPGDRVTVVLGDYTVEGLPVE